MEFWVQFCVFSVAFSSQGIFDATELDKSWKSFEIARGFGDVQICFLDATTGCDNVKGVYVIFGCFEESLLV